MILRSRLLLHLLHNYISESLEWDWSLKWLHTALIGIISIIENSSLKTWVTYFFDSLNRQFLRSVYVTSSLTTFTVLAQKSTSIAPCNSVGGRHTN